MRRFRDSLSRFGYGALFVGVTIGSGLSTIAVLVRGGEEVTVPPFVGKTVREAEHLASLQKLSLRIQDEHFSEEWPSGSIVKQTVPPGDLVRTGRTVGISISKGPRERLAPRVAGLTREAADIVIQSSALVTEEVASTCSDEVPAGSVVAQDPRAGENAIGERVRIVISNGPCADRYLLANLLGRGLNEVLRELDEHGFTFRSIRVEDGEGVPETILAVDPPPHSFVRATDRVELTVSSPPSAEEGEKDSPESRLVFLSFETLPGFFRRRGRIQLLREGETETRDVPVALLPGERGEFLFWLLSGTRVVVEVDDREILRTLY